MFNRIMGVITLKVPIYREIADDQTATTQAAMIVVIVSLIQGFITGLVKETSGTVTTSLVSGLVNSILTLALGLIGWVFSAWVLAFVAKALDGKTNTSEMLRVTGYVQIFGLVSILNILVLVTPLLGCLTGLMGFIVAILRIIGYTIGVREAAEFTTGKAIITAIVAGIINFIIVVTIGGIILTAVISAFAIAG